VGIGMYIRDDFGEFVLARTYWFSPLCDIAVGEAVGLHTTLEWVSNLQFNNVDFASDCHKVVESSHTNVNDNNKFCCIINACRHLYPDIF